MTCILRATCSIILILQACIIAKGFSSTPSPSEKDKIISLPGQPPVKFKQYAGYIRVDSNSKRALFYYFVESETNPHSKPLVLWLNGGPGCSSLGAGAFSEHGPFRPKGNGLVQNYYSWNKEANILYLESPAGVGFSYSSNVSFYNYVNDDITARDNLKFLQKWLAKYPEYKNRDLFITGESYGGNVFCLLTLKQRELSLNFLSFSTGHYVPQLANLVLKSNLRSNLKGVAIGNPLLEFNTDFNSRAGYLWSHGLISDSTFDMYNTICNYSQVRRQSTNGELSPACSKVVAHTDDEVGKYIDAYDVTLDVCLVDASSQSKVLDPLWKTEKLGGVDVCVMDETTSYLNRKDVQKALHAELIGVGEWSMCTEVTKYDMKELELSTLPLLGRLVKSGIRVMVYSGDQDSVLPFSGTRMLINRLAKELRLKTTQPYRSWLHGRQVGGWTQVYGNLLSFATIRGASHEAPFSQPHRSLALFTTFVQGKPLPQPN